MKYYYKSIYSRKKIQIEEWELRISKPGVGIKKGNKVSWEKSKIALHGFQNLNQNQNFKLGPSPLILIFPI